MAAPQTIPVFRSRVAFIGDSRCPGVGCDSTSEELSDGHSLTFVRHGAFVKQIGRQRSVADPNQIVFFARERPFRVTHLEGCSDECTVFSLRMDVLLDVLGRRDPAAAKQPGRPFGLDAAAASAELQRAHLSLLARARRGVLSDIAAEEAVVGLFERMLDAIRPPARESQRISPATRRAHTELADAAQQLLATRFREPLGLDDVARQVHASPFHLCRIFRNATGRSIGAYRTQLRLRSALAHLTEGESDLTSLALNLGFVDHSHFTNAFRREVGITPSEFRRSLGLARLPEIG